MHMYKPFAENDSSHTRGIKPETVHLRWTVLSRFFFFFFLFFFFVCILSSQLGASSQSPVTWGERFFPEFLYYRFLLFLHNWRVNTATLFKKMVQGSLIFSYLSHRLNTM